MTSKKGPPNYRSSVTGNFVTEDYAKKHPKTTQKEHNRPPSKPKKPKK
ncbi:MAG: multidrug transporter [Alphaproteobacteria bacterium]|nr:multidrug transporter [Alphaproteobacteria bacterium]